jgi:hypothetical protein
MQRQIFSRRGVGPARLKDPRWQSLRRNVLAHFEVKR